MYKVVKVNAALNPACADFYETVFDGIETLEQAARISLGYSLVMECITRVALDLESAGVTEEEE